MLGGRRERPYRRFGTTVPGRRLPCVEVDDVADVCRRAEALAGPALGGKVLVPATTAANALVHAHVVYPTAGISGGRTPPVG